MRATNIELCRIIAMTLIVMLHSGFQSLGIPKNISETSAYLLLMQAVSSVGVNVFILITGYFSSKPKLKSLINLAYICLFYAIVVSVLGLIIGTPFPWKRVLFITSSNWFIPSYICLLFFAPIINRFCDNVSLSEMFKILLGLLIVFTWFGFLPALSAIQPGMNNGCSTIWFIYVYMVGRAIRKKDGKMELVIYIVSVILTSAIAYIILLRGYKVDFLLLKIYANNNPLILFASIAFFTFFLKTNIRHSSFINYIAKSSLAILLFHASLEFTSLMKIWFPYIYDRYSGFTLGFIWLLSILLICGVAIIIDQVRILTYKPIEKYLNTKSNGI